MSQDEQPERPGGEERLPPPVDVPVETMPLATDVRPTAPPRQRNASFHSVLVGEETDVLELLCNGTPGSMLAMPAVASGPPPWRPLDGASQESPSS